MNVRSAGPIWGLFVLSIVAAGVATSPADATGSKSHQAQSQAAAQSADSRYVINGGEVYDKKTDLTWARCSVGQHWNDGIGCVGVIKGYTFDEAQTLADGVWRVPSKAELGTLLKPGHMPLIIDEVVFPDMDSNNKSYWTSTIESYSPCYVHFGEGLESCHILPSETLAVRLVRSGQ